jgi:lysophospholipase L1-like esterase
MTLLVVGDSHCRDMSIALKFLAPLDNYYTITKGRQIDEIVPLYRAQMINVSKFAPTVIILHVGHNDAAWHPVYNTLPLVSRDVARITLAFADEISTNHPSAQLYISNIFPRTHTPRSILSLESVLKHNQLAKRHFNRLRKLADTRGYIVPPNMALWSSISSVQENPICFRPDGLHLSSEGMKLVVIDWLNLFYS